MYMLLHANIEWLGITELVNLIILVRVDYSFILLQFEKQVYDIVGSSWRLVTNTQVLAISRAMIHAETPVQRNVLLKVLQAREMITC